jgi:hypothetical protein
MIIKRRKTGHSFGPDGRRLSTCGSLPSTTNNRLFQLGKKLTIQRASFMPGLSKFQRPMQGRRAYKGDADIALKRSTLGMKKRVNGMQNIFDRAGKGLNFVASRRQEEKGDTDSCSQSEEEEEDRPFEPLMVWQSPHQGGDARGLPSQL